MPEQNGDKSQEPTQHRRQKARQDGMVPKSQDLGSAVLLLVGMLALLISGGGLVEFIARYTERQLSGEAWLQGDLDLAMSQWDVTIEGLSGSLMPIFGLLLLAAVLINLAQVGFLFVPSKLNPDISRLDPLKGLRRLFSVSSVARLGFGIFKIFVIAAVAFVSLYGERATILGLTNLEIPQVSYYLVQILVWTTIKIGLALLVLALFDYAFQRWKHEQDLKMTPQEVREEMKNLEGDPQIIARRRAVQRQLVLNRLSDLVPTADVVITNPTELAIAVQYDPETMAAPVVVAKGAGHVAERIRKIALENGIPIVERKPLARALYRDVDVRQPIPHERYAAVAEVLAYVYQLQGKPIPAPPSEAA